MSTLAQDELEKRVDAKVTAFVACVLSNLTDEDARRVDFRVPPGVCAKHMSPYARASPRTFRALTCASTTTARSFSPARSRGGRGKSKFVYKSPLPKYAARQRPKNTAAGSRTHAAPGAGTRSGGARAVRAHLRQEARECRQRPRHADNEQQRRVRALHRVHQVVRAPAARDRRRGGDRVVEQQGGGRGGGGAPVPARAVGQR